jgi:drug/metabolite transporter (DMT)-like permease
MTSPKILPWLAFAAISFIWGSTWLAHKWALADFTPAGLATTRFLIAGAACFLIGRLRREQWPKRSELKHLLLAGVVLTGLANVLTAWTLQYIPSGVGAVLQAPIPVWLALLSLRTDPLSKRGWAAVIAGFVGVTLVMWPTETGHLPIVPATVCVLTAAVWCWASMHQRKHVTSGGLFTNIGLQMAQSALLGVIITPLFFGYTHGHGISQGALAATAYLIVFGSVIAFAAYLYLTRVWHPARAGSFAYLNPVIALALGAWLGNEPMTAKLVLGMMVILLAVALLQWAPNPRAAEAAAKLD